MTVAQQTKLLLKRFHFQETAIHTHNFENFFGMVRLGCMQILLGNL